MYGAFHLFCTIDFSSAFYTQHFLFNHYLWFVSKIISFSLCRMAHNCVDSVHCAPQLDEQYHYCSKSFFFHSSFWRLYSYCQFHSSPPASCPHFMVCNPSNMYILYCVALKIYVNCITVWVSFWILLALLKIVCLNSILTNVGLFYRFYCSMVFCFMNLANFISHSTLMDI